MQSAQPLYVLITGMHRSGTSLLSALLSELGVWLGEPGALIEANEENPAGFFERRDVRQLNDDVLFATGCDWTEIDDFDPNQLPKSVRKAFRGRAKAIFEQLAEAAPHAVVGIKEPRLCPLMSLWRDCLPGPALQIHVTRPAAEVALSLARRNDLPEAVAHHLHEAYLVAALAGADPDRTLLTRYHDCLHAPAEEARRLRAFLNDHGAELPPLEAATIESVSRDDLYRSRPETDTPAPPDSLTGLLDTLADHRLPDPLPPMPAPGREVLAWQRRHRFTAWRRASDRAQRLRGRIDRLESEQAEWSRTLQMAEAARDENGERARGAEAALEEAQALSEDLESRWKAADERGDALEEQLEQSRARVARLETRLEAAATRAAELESTLKDSRRRMRDLERERARLEAELEAAGHREHTLSQQLSEQEAALDAAKTRHEREMAASAERQEREREEARERERALDAEREASLSRQRHLESVTRDLRKRNLDGQTSLFEVKQDRDRKQVTIGKLRRELADARQAHGHLQTDYQALRNSMSWRITAPLRSALGLFPKRWFDFRNRATKHPAVRAGDGPAPPLLPHTALVVSWDIGHNALGRSYMLAEVLERVFRHVVIVGFRFPQHGERTWSPLRNSRIPVIGLRSSPFPEFLDELERIAVRVKPDMVFACKARLPSLELGALIRRHCDCPMVLDIDDHELAFVDHCDPVTLEALEEMERGALSHEREPYGTFWTRAAEDARRVADAVLVSNPALQERFGGLLLPHVRDEQRMDPERRDRNAMRARLGIPPEARVVLFFGTPRRHKGIEPLARAVASLPDDNALLVVVGDAPDRHDANLLVELAGERLLLLGNQPFERIPDILSVADAVCLPQDPDHPVSRYQLPAKAVDAIAMNVPLLVSDTPPMRWLVDQGLAIHAPVESLPERLAQVLSGDAGLPSTEERRRRFLDEFSYATGAARLRLLAADLIAKHQAGSQVAARFDRFLAAQRKVLDHPPPETAERSGSGVDVVLFWKQNDTLLYGRRVDMVARTLAARTDVRRVLVFDAPISEYDLNRLRKKQEGPSQNRWVYRKTYEKLLGQHDHGKISHHVFVHPAGVYDIPHRTTPGRRPLAEGFIPFVAGELLRENVEPSEALFWFYPRFYLALPLIEAFTPARVIADVVDDQREWPGLPSQEVERLTAHYEELLARSDLTLVNCAPMLEKMRPLAGGRIECVPNGCDADPPSRPPAEDDAAFRRLSQATGPVIGYVGNLEAKIDVPLIERVARANPHACILLLGSAHATNAALALRELDNVIMPGVVPYEAVGAWISRMDVAMVPHLHTSMTESMNPLKVFVYLQWGVPVVSTDIANIGYEGPLLHVARDHDEFVAAIRQAIEHPPADAGVERDAFVAANHWGARFTPLLDDWLNPADAPRAENEEPRDDGRTAPRTATQGIG